jgi:pimeloyl-ACP methyl ester carboxylesterase
MPLLLLVLALSATGQPLPRLAHAGLSLTIDNGALRIAHIRPQSPAATAGLQPGDILLTPAPLTLLRRPHGDSVPVQIRRATQTLTVNLTYLAPPKESQPDFDIEYAAVQVDSHRRRAIITIPRNRPNPPVLLWLPGSGCATIESLNATSPETQLLYALTRAGYKTVRVEKSGIGDSEGPPCYSAEASLSLDVRAYAAAIAQLRPAKVFLFGHSAGATLAPLVLQAAGKVEGVILAGGMGTDFRQYILEMRRRELERSGQPVAPEMAIHTRCLDALLLQNQSPDSIEAAMPDCRRRVRFDTHPAYIAEWAKLDIAKQWRAAPKLPVLVLHGTADTVTSQSQSETLVRHIPGARLEVLPMDHDLCHEKTPGKLDPRAIQASLNFLKKRR